MAAWNGSRDVNDHRDQSGGTWHPALPPSLHRPDNAGDNYLAVPLWERKFCRNAYDIPWETFCENKRFIPLFRNIMDWYDSGAFKNFEDAKERFRAKYYGEPFEDPVLDPDMYIDEVDHFCKVDPELVAELDKIPGLDLVVDLGWGEPFANLIPTGCGGPVANLVPTGWGEPVANLTPTGWGEPVANLTTDPAWGSQGNQTPEAVWGAHPYLTPNNMNNNLHGGGSSNNWHQKEVDTGRMLNVGGCRMWSGGISGGRMWSGGAGNWNGGGGSGNGSGRNWNVGNGSRRNWNGGGGGVGRNWNGGIGGSGSGKPRNQDEGQHQQRNGDGKQRNKDKGWHRIRSCWQRQGQGGRKMEWRPVQHNRAPKDDPAA